MKWILVVVWMASPSTPETSATSSLRGQFDSAAECLTEASNWTGTGIGSSFTIGHTLTSVSCVAVADVP